MIYDPKQRMTTPHMETELRGMYNYWSKSFNQ